jgi:replicative DNA helicase
VSNTNIERNLLASILFNTDLIDEVEKLLKANDLYLPAHQEILSAIFALHKNNLPVDEEFILKKFPKIDKDAMISILSANPISDITAYAKELKKDSITRQIQIISIDLQHKFDLKLIDKLQSLKDELEQLESITPISKKDNKKLESILDKFDIDFDKIENIKFEYLMKHFLVKNEITMISALPGTGKSLLSVAVANMLLVENNIERVYYIDGDNGAGTLKDRNIHHLKRQHGTKFRYFVGLTQSELWKIIQTLQKMDLSNSLIVFDSIKNFISGDRDKNKDVSPVMQILKTLRNNGATIIFLHHQNKKQKDFESDYAGSSAFAEDTSNAFKMTRNDDKNSLILKPFKARAGDLHELAFIYNAHNHTLAELDISVAKQTKEMDEMIAETIEFLKSSKNKPMWSELSDNLKELGYDKEKASKIIKNGEGKLWDFVRGDRNNKKLYSLIGDGTQKRVAVETVYEEIPNTTPITQTTPRSLFSGTSSEIKSMDTNYDNSDNQRLTLDSKNFPRENSNHLAAYGTPTTQTTPRSLFMGASNEFESNVNDSDSSDNSLAILPPGTQSQKFSMPTIT